MRKVFTGALSGLIAAGALTLPPLAHAQTARPTWPHTVAMAQSSVTVYQPQAISWSDQKVLTARAALAITPPGAAAPMLGTIEMTVATVVDLNSRSVAISNPQLLATHFPTLDTGQAQRVEAQIKAALPGMQMRSVPLDTVLLSLKQTENVKPVAVNNDPPVIFYSANPASLVVFDGEPVMAPIGTTGLSFAVNTNWDVFSDGKAWYLRNDMTWFAAPAYAGPFKPISKLPAAFNNIPNDKNFAEARKAIPARAPNPAGLPAIIVSTKPAEIIVTGGPPQFVPVPGTGLQVVKNTASDLFLDPAKGRFYYLVSGRWFSAEGLDGPWIFATADLPPDFAMIQPDGVQGHVLASVPNTAQAQAAVLQAQIPQQATLQRSSAKLTVVYAGPPQFAPIPGTPIKYATNTSMQVLEIEGRYYACYQGAWFVAASPAGPWGLADSVPQIVYTIPPSSPMYPVTYVTVQAATPTTVAYAYTAGYMMGFVTAGVLVYGTGYYYPPVVIPGRVPAYLPYPYSYAGGVYYNPANGVWARGGAVYGPYGAAKAGAAYNPATGAYARGAAVYGPNGGAGAFSAYNPSTGSYARGSASWNANGGSANASFYNARTGVAGTTTQNANMYQRWGSTTVSTPTQTVTTQSASGPRGSAGTISSTTGAQGAAYNTARGQGAAVQTSGGDVYAGRDGNAYKHTSDGWSTWNNGSWQSVQPPSGAPTVNRPTSQAAPASATNATRTATPQAARPAETPAQRPTTNQYTRPATAPTSRPTQTMDRSSFQQLEQDRFARGSAGQRSFGGFREGGAAANRFGR